MAPPSEHDGSTTAPGADQFGEHGRRILQVDVHWHVHHAASRSEPGRERVLLADVAQQPHARTSSRPAASSCRNGPRAVGRAVVDEDVLVPSDHERGQHRIDAVDERRDRILLVEDADDDRELHRCGGPPPRLPLVTRLAAVERPEAAARPSAAPQFGTAARSRKNWCTKAIAMLPSPTAAATRLTGLKRTSPHAKMPGTLVSRDTGRGRAPASAGPRVDAGQHVALGVERDLRREPARLGIGADEDEEAARLEARLSRPTSSRDVDRLDRRLAVGRRDLGLASGPRCSSASRAGRSDTATCSCRASRGRMIVTLRACAREVHRGLAGRVACADDVDVEPVRVRRLAARRAVEDALPREAVEALDREPPPRHAAGEDDRLRAQDVAAVQMDVARRRVDAGDRARDEDLGAEPPRLLEGPIASASPDTPEGSRGSSRSGTTCRPGRRAPRARSRSSRGPRRRRTRPRPARRGHRRRSRVVLRCVGLGLSLSSSATRRNWGRTTVLPLTILSAG